MPGARNKWHGWTLAVMTLPLLSGVVLPVLADRQSESGAPQWGGDHSYSVSQAVEILPQNDQKSSGQPPDLELPAMSVHEPGEGKKISIVEAVQRAIIWHPSLAEALGQLGQQREQVNVARAGYYPQISAGISTERRSSTRQNEDAFTVNASQMLYDFGKTSGSVDIAEYGVNREQANVLLSVDTLARDTAKAAIEVQRYQAMLIIADKQIDGITDLLQLAQKRSKLGASTRSDEVQAQSRLEAAQGTKLQIAAQLQVWKRVLQSYVGSDAPIGVMDRVPETLQNSCANAVGNLDNVPEIMVAEAQRAEAVASIERERAELFPTLSLDAGFNRYLDQNMVGDDSEFTVGVSLSSNLFQGGAIRARSRAATHALQSAKSAKEAAYLSVTQGLNEARDQSESFKRRYSILEARTRSIIETQRLYRDQYLSLGTRSLLDLLNAEQEIHQSQFDKENTLYDLRGLQVDCLYSTARVREAFELDDRMFQGVSIEDE